MFAPGTRPALGSWTTPRSVPHGFCALMEDWNAMKDNARQTAVANRSVALILGNDFSDMPFS
jgi:hypothetical protein